MESFFGILIILAILFVFWRSMREGGKIKEKKERADGEIKDMSESILVVTSSDIPTKEVKEVLGNVTGISSSATTEAGFERAEREAMAEVMRRGLEMGANAIIDLRMTTGSYEQQGAKWMVTRVVYNGTAVKI